MNNKIKEILEIQEDSDYKKLSIEDIMLLQDYITNLQEENQNYKSKNENAREFMIENCEIIPFNNGWIIRSELTTIGLGKLFKILNGGDK